jgi:NADH-quinone oxidoreductase subunit M
MSVQSRSIARALARGLAFLAGLPRRCALPVLLLAFALAFGVAPARASVPPAAPAGRIVLSLVNGVRGPLVLEPADGPPATWSGTIKVTNAGPDPLTVSRIAIRGDEDDVRSPPRLSVRFVEGAATTATLPPGGSRDVIVSWAPERPQRVEQAFGHVVVTSTDERSGEVAMGFRAQLPTGLGWVGEHALSLLIAWPLVVAGLAALARFAGRRDHPAIRTASIVASLLELLLALWVYRHFAPDVGRADGNEGFQLVERCVWVRSLGAEWYLGVDGASVLLVVLAAAVGLVAVLVAGESRRTDAYYAAMGVLSAGVIGALVALDLTLVFLARAVVLLSLVLLVGGWGGPRAHRAAAKLGVVGALGLAALALAFAALSGGSGRTFLVDGTTVAHTMSIPELARTSFAAKGPVLGLPFADLTWGLLFVAIIAASPLVPLHGWLPDALEEGPAGAAIVLGGIVVALGPYLLLRVGLEALPEGARWAAPSVAALGAISAGWGALCAIAQRDLRRFVAYAVVGNAGLCLYGLGALTPQGIAGGALALFAHGLAAALLLGVASAFERRVKTCDVVRIQGLAADAPVLASLLIVGLALSLGAPGLVGAWALLLAFVGGFVRHPFFALMLAGALVVSAAAHTRVARLLVFERADPAWRRSRRLEAFGGRLPDATSLEMASLAPMAALVLALGIWPAPALSPVERAARDASAVLEQPTP